LAHRLRGVGFGAALLWDYDILFGYAPGGSRAEGHRQKAAKDRVIGASGDRVIGKTRASPGMGTDDTDQQSEEYFRLIS
jgi:hypothetical protein